MTARPGIIGPSQRGLDLLAESAATCTETLARASPARRQTDFDKGASRECVSRNHPSRCLPSVAHDLAT